MKRITTMMLALSVFSVPAVAMADDLPESCQTFFKTMDEVVAMSGAQGEQMKPMLEQSKQQIEAVKDANQQDMACKSGLQQFEQMKTMMQNQGKAQ